MKKNAMAKGQWAEFKTEFEKTLGRNCGKDIKWFVKVSVLAGFVLSLAGIAISFSANLSNFYITLIAFAAFTSPFPLHFLLQQYLSELNRAKLEALVPDLLLQASAFPSGTGFGKIIAYFSDEKFGLLGGEFEKAKQEIEKGSTVPTALDNIGKRCKSKVVDRAVLLLKQGYNSGADMSNIFREAASDLIETNAILRERNAALVVEKYTLLLAGGLIVPLVLGLLVGMVSSMDFSAFELLDFGASVEEKTALLQSTILANQIYIVEYSLIAAFFVASQEGKPKKALLYACFLLPVSVICFNAAKVMLAV